MRKSLDKVESMVQQDGLHNINCKGVIYRHNKGG